MRKMQAADESLLRDVEPLHANEMSPIFCHAQARAGLWKRNPDHPWLEILRRGGTLFPATILERGFAFC